MLLDLLDGKKCYEGEEGRATLMKAYGDRTSRLMPHASLQAPKAVRGRKHAGLVLEHRKLRFCLQVDNFVHLVRFDDMWRHPLQTGTEAPMNAVNFSHVKTCACISYIDTLTLF